MRARQEVISSKGWSRRTESQLGLRDLEMWRRVAIESPNVIGQATHSGPKSGKNVFLFKQCAGSLLLCLDSVVLRTVSTTLCL